MVYAWMPGVNRVSGTVSDGILTGGAPRVVWGTTESDPHVVSATAAARDLQTANVPTHLVWNPLRGEFAQLLPATSAAPRSSRGEHGLVRGHEGRVCIVIQVVGFALDPFTEGALNGLPQVLSWLDSWGIPRRWPAGQPEPSAPHLAELDERLWALGGHFGLSQVPGAQSGIPGKINPERLLGGSAMTHEPPPSTATVRGRFREPDDLLTPGPTPSASTDCRAFAPT